MPFVTEVESTRKASLLCRWPLVQINQGGSEWEPPALLLGMLPRADLCGEGWLHGHGVQAAVFHPTHHFLTASFCGKSVKQILPKSEARPRATNQFAVVVLGGLPHGLLQAPGPWAMLSAPSTTPAPGHPGLLEIRASFHWFSQRNASKEGKSGKAKKFSFAVSE